MTTFHLPRNNEVLTVVNSKVGDIKPFIELALGSDEVKEKVDPYLTNGGVEHHKLLDYLRAADIIVKYDDKHGGNISARGLPAIDVVNQLKVVLRRLYELNEHGKVVGVNPKRLILIAHKPTVEPAPSEG
jgi:hypothetical protein